MRAHRAVLVPLFLLFACCLFAQEESGYFSLTSNKTYAPGQKPTISVWATHADQLEFRVYRVNDPVKFFSRLADPHQFGGRVPQPPHTKTWLERFHDWKHRIFAWIRDFFRHQFTADNRSIIREARTSGEEKKKPQAPAQIFAQIPLINSQQLVATWREPMNRGREYWESSTVTIPVTERGVYLVEATDGKLRAYTIVMVTGIAIITKTAPGTILAFVADRQTGAAVANADTYFFVSKKQIASQTSNADGLSHVTVTEPRPEDAMVMARTKDDFAVSAPWSYWMSTEAGQNLTAYVYTDRPVYRPGDTVHYKAILRTRRGLNYQPPANTDYTVQIQDQEAKVVLNTQAKSSAMGTLHGEYTIPSDASLGNYSIQIGGNYGGSFIIEEYKKPEYEVRVTPDSRVVLQGSAISAVIDAKYYFGDPVAGASVKYSVYREPYWFPLWYDPEDEEVDPELDG
ncbi:MAG TPA: MG2 domain-containing protein, partial [Terriglobales bacterium]|nr:MG2 domain-containing protein [Terriglobales bacterium]